jgi:hypothetical protein
MWCLLYPNSEVIIFLKSFFFHRIKIENKILVPWELIASELTSLRGYQETISVLGDYFIMYVLF